jgi:Coenzyme PQQ synthesis protein D (PqqD)
MLLKPLRAAMQSSGCYGRVMPACAISPPGMNRIAEINVNTPAALADDAVLVLPASVSLQPLGEDEGGVLLKMDTGDMFTLNDTAVEFLSRLDGKRKVGAIIKQMLDLFEVDADTLRTDIAELVADLNNAGISLES